MEYFHKAHKVCLRSDHGEYLIAKDTMETVFLGQGRRSSAWWSVELIPNSGSIRLKSCYDKYLTATDQPSFLGMTGCKVLQSLPSLSDSSHELKPVMDGSHIKLRTHYNTFLRANRGHHNQPTSITHDLHHNNTILWCVEVDERGEGYATVGSHKTGEGSCVTESPPGVRYRHHFWKLKSLLLDNSGRKDIFVKGGLGTTALVREVCADVQENFDTVAWISAPRKNDSELICEEILLQLIFESWAFPKNFQLDPHRVSLSGYGKFSIQQEKRCLIVVDSIDDERTWERFNEIQHMVKTCQVIFIARRETGSSYSRICQYRYELETYELEDLSYVPPSYHLKNFLEEGFPSSSKKFCQLIVRMCERLPTAIVSFLRQSEWWLSDSSELKDEWAVRIPSDEILGVLHLIEEMVSTLYEQFYGERDHELDHFQQVLEILCQEDRVFCFLYLSIFPQNSLISSERVSCFWAAEGILSNLERAEHFLDDFLWRGCIHLVEKSSDGELYTFRLDKRVRKIIVSLFGSFNYQEHTARLFSSFNYQERTARLGCLGCHPFSSLNGNKTFYLSWIFKPDRPSDVSSEKRHVSSDEDSPTEYEDWQLLWGDFRIPSFPYNLGECKVLDLTDAHFKIVPDAVFELLNVRYLSLDNTLIKAIPGSIRELKHLEFLDAKHSLVTKLPREVARLKKIRHIQIYHHKKDPLMESYNLIGFEACRIRELKCLEKLCFVESNLSILEDLGNLTKLRHLGITKLRNEHGNLFCSSLEKLEGLKTLNVHAFDEDEIIDILCLSSPPRDLKHLCLHGRLEKLPDWISSLDGLTKIILRWSQLEEDLLSALGKLPELVELKLHQAYNGGQLDFENEQFPKLKILLLDELKRLGSMSLEQGTMPCLENLTISCCQWLERIPSGIEHIPTIRKLTFVDMPHEFKEMVSEDHENDRNLEHIQEVYFTQWVSDHWETHRFDRGTRASWQMNTE